MKITLQLEVLSRYVRKDAYYRKATKVRTLVRQDFEAAFEHCDVLAMPTTLPGISSTEARRTLQIQDLLLKEFPEVVTAQPEYRTSDPLRAVVQLGDEREDG